MKRKNSFTKIAATLLALFMIVSFAACNAAPAPMEPGGNGGLENMFPEFNGPASKPSYDSSINGGVLSPEGGNADQIIPTPPDGVAPDEEVEGEPDAPADVPADPDAPTDAPADPDVPETEEQSETNQVVEPVAPITLLKGSFTSTADQPFSTFSADVDTASYTYFRKLANAGYGFMQLQNSGNNFRIEEFINYFKYDVEQPKDGELFGVRTEIVPCPWENGNLLFRVTLQAEEAKPSAGNNLVFLIDVSGSMTSQDKLPLLKKAFSYLVGNLGANDTISIVTYSGREEVVLEGCNGLQTDRIMNAINSLKASGSTNGEAGLTMAYRIAEAQFIEGGNNRIIMASDGDLNVGISSSSELKNYIEQKRDQGVYLSVLGFGTGNYRDANMEALADNGNGVYYYIDGESEAEKVFGTDLAGTMYAVANDVKLQVEFDPEMVESYRLVGYDNRVLDKEDFENDAKDAGDVGASHQVTVVYEIKPIFKSGPVKTTMMTLRVRYKNPGESLSLLNEYAIAPNVSEASEDMRFITAVIETVALMNNRDYKGDITVESIYGELLELRLEDAYKTEFRELVEKLVQSVK